MRDMGDAREALEKWFSSRGFRQLRPEELLELEEEPDMAFEGPDGLAFAIFLDGKTIGDRGAFTDIVMKASALRDECHFLYLAVPKTIAPFVDTEVLKKRSMGLLIVDEEGVIEALPSPRRPPRRGQAVGGGPLPEELANRIALLEDRISVLENELMAIRPLLNEISSIRGLKEDFKALSSRLEALSRRIDMLSSSVLVRAPAMGPPAKPTAPPSPPEPEGLPSFFKDNPWLEILARRGRDELPA